MAAYNVDSDCDFAFVVYTKYSYYSYISMYIEINILLLVSMFQTHFVHSVLLKYPLAISTNRYLKNKAFSIALFVVHVYSLYMQSS